MRQGLRHSASNPSLPVHGLDHFSIIDPGTDLESAQTQRTALEERWNAHFKGTPLEGQWTYEDVAKIDRDESWRLSELDQLIANLKADPAWFSKIPPEVVSDWKANVFAGDPATEASTVETATPTGLRRGGNAIGLTPQEEIRAALGYQNPSHSTWIDLGEGKFAHRYNICTTPFWIYEAWERIPSVMDNHSSVTSIRREDGEFLGWAGQIGTRPLPPEINAIPVGEERFAACNAYRQAQYEEAHALICQAFPEAAHGTKDGDRIQVIFDRDAQPPVNAATPLMTASIPESLEVATTTTISRQQIADTLVNAFEGGSGYWARIQSLEAPPQIHWSVNHDQPGLGPYRAVDYPLNGGAVVLVGHEKGEGPWRLDAEAIQRGLAILAEKRPDALIQIREGNGDMNDADAFLQCAVLGEIVYG